jgi:hypothetical protein
MKRTMHDHGKRGPLLAAWTRRSRAPHGVRLRAGGRGGTRRGPARTSHDGAEGEIGAQRSQGRWAGTVPGCSTQAGAVPVSWQTIR